MSGLGRALLLPLPGWVAADDAADHWQGGHRGMIARRLIEQLAERSGRTGAVEPPRSRLPARPRFAQRLRERLRP